MINVLKKKIFLILFLGILVVLIGFIFWFIYKALGTQLLTPTLQEQRSAETEVTEKEFEEKESSASTPTISSFKTYHNQEWGFEFQYPNEFVIEEKYFSSYYSKFNLYILDKIGDGVELAFLVNIVLPEFAERSFTGLDKKTKEIVIDSVPGVEYEYKFNQRREKFAILPFGEFRLILGIHYEEYEDLYRQVLSTFRFLK